MPDHEVPLFKSGVHNFLSDEIIPTDAAQDESNWITQDGRLKLTAGRLKVGTEGAQGSIQGEIFGYKVDGTKIHWRKTSAGKIQYFDGTTWQDVVTGLSTTADYKFSNYSSLAGTFTYAFGVDGIYKFHNAVPTSFVSMYDPIRNFKGFAFIDKGRSILWNRPEDKTGLYGSHIDRQDSTVYTTETAQTLASGDGSTKAFSGTLSGAGQINFFGFTPYGPIAAAKNISAITTSGLTTITATGHGLAAGDYVLFLSIGGTTQLNNLTAKIYSAPDADTLVFQIDSSSFTAYTSGGTVTKIELFTDSYLGTLSSNLGGTGTLNYLTGAWTLTFNTAPTNVSSNIKANYQYENSNNGGVTDFTKSATRVAGEGFQVPQDEGGDAILSVLIGQDGSYYSLKSQSAYQFTLDDADTNPTNIVYRRNIGVPFHRAGVSTNKGIVFINTANPEKPELTILQRNPISNFVEPVILFPQFKFANYTYDACNIDTWERYTIIFCKSSTATANDTILLCDLAQGSVDIQSYNGQTSTTDSGNLYIGSSITQTIYELFNGFDDDGLPVQNYWISGGAKLIPNIRPSIHRPIPQGLKKARKLRLKGRIDADQRYSIYISYDDAGFQLVGTIRGDGSYVDYSQPQLIGAHFIGQTQVGGDVTSTIYPYFTEIKLKAPKFRKRTIKIVAEAIGYVDIDNMTDHAITVFEDRLPSRFRQRQNVSLDDTQTDLATPQY